MELTDYSATSPFVQEFAIDGNGLPDSAPASDVIDTPRKVVLIDAFLRKHYDTLNSHDLSVVTGVRHSEIQDILQTFHTEGLIELEDSLYTVANMNDRVTALREFQLSFLD